MTNSEFIECVVKMMKQLDNKTNQQIFYYVHDKYIKRTGD